jgi:hypothetical protein
MAVRTFLHYALEVPDQAVGQRFYEDFGLVDGTGRSDAVRLRPERLARDTVLLYGGPRKRLHHLCYGAAGEDFVRVRDLDYIPEGCAWEPRDFPPEDSLYVWGPPCPADFGENKEAWT